MAATMDNGHVYFDINDQIEKKMDKLFREHSVLELEEKQQYLKQKNEENEKARRNTEKLFSNIVTSFRRNLSFLFNNLTKENYEFEALSKGFLPGNLLMVIEVFLKDMVKNETLNDDKICVLEQLKGKMIEETFNVFFDLYGG